MPEPALRAAFDGLAQRLDREHDPQWHPLLLGPDEPRAEAEAFLAAIYRERFGATLREFMPWLLGFADATGALRAVVGLRPARGRALFVEQYLDAPAERAVSMALGRTVSRDSLIEVGSLAALRAGDARRLILSLTRGLHEAGQRWVLFTATRQLRNAFERMGLQPTALGPARPTRLHAAATDWGRYYDADPVLLCGDIAAGAAYLDAASKRKVPARALRDTQLEFAGAAP